MSKQKAEKTIRVELSTLNEIIDQKIIKGLSYKRESRRHKALLSQLTHMNSTRVLQPGWFGRSLRLVSTLML